MSTPIEYAPHGRESAASKVNCAVLVLSKPLVCLSVQVRRLGDQRLRWRSTANPALVIRLLSTIGEFPNATR
jgi:hypothetical protein